MQNKISGQQIASIGYSFTGVTTNATPTEIFLEGITNNRLTLEDNSSAVISCYVVARRTDSGTESAGYIQSAAFERNAGAATISRIGTVQNEMTKEDTGPWNIDLTADTTNGSIKITVTGQAAKTIQWVVRALLVTYPQ